MEENVLPLKRFVMISLSVHFLLFGAQYLINAVYSKAEFAVEAAPTSIDVVFVQEEEEVLPPPVEDTPDEIITIEEPAEEIVPVPVKEFISPEEISRKEYDPVDLPLDENLEFKKFKIAPLVKNSVKKEIQPFERLTQQGALSEVNPDYLRNPAPAYPHRARQKGWEGLVLLKVLVNTSGHPVDIAVEKTSGHSILDDAAVKSVKGWKFFPARLGNVAVESTVEVPVRFQLE